MMKYTPFLLLGAVLLLAGCMADLRPDYVKRSNYDVKRETEKAQVILNRTIAVSGLDKLAKAETYTVSFEDEFLNMLGRAGKPYKENKVSMKLDYIPNSFDGKMTFSSGKLKGQSWGVQSWKTYTQVGEQSPVFKQDKDILFWVPTYQYFVELVLRLRNAPILAYAGDIERGGVSYKRVLATWEQLEPTKKIDQYVLWINAETFMLDMVEYTVRDQFNFLTGVAFCEDYQEYNGIRLPREMRVKSKLDSKKYMHVMRIMDMELNRVSAESLRPNKSLKVLGDEK